MQPGAAGTRSSGAAHGHGALWKPKAKAGQTHRRNVHEMDTTPGWGIADQFSMAAGMALARERQFPPCWQGEGRAGQAAGLRPSEVSCLSFPSQERSSISSCKWLAGPWPHGPNAVPGVGTAAAVGHC